MLLRSLSICALARVMRQQVWEAEGAEYGQPWLTIRRGRAQPTLISSRAPIGVAQSSEHRQGLIVVGASDDSRWGTARSKADGARTRGAAHAAVVGEASRAFVSGYEIRLEDVALSADSG